MSYSPDGSLLALIREDTQDRSEARHHSFLTVLDVSALISLPPSRPTASLVPIEPFPWPCLLRTPMTWLVQFSPSGRWLAGPLSYWCLTVVRAPERGAPIAVHAPLVLGLTETYYDVRTRSEKKIFFTFLLRLALPAGLLC